MYIIQVICFIANKYFTSTNTKNYHASVRAHIYIVFLLH
jgi:hypothetical protein